MAFSALRTLKQQVTLPEQVTLKQPELGWYLQSCAEKLFPLSSEDLVIDYRVIDNRAYLNGVRKSEIVFWQNLLHDSGFLLTAIDVAPCVLRYIARYAGLPDESWLIHYRQGSGYGLAPSVNLQLIIKSKKMTSPLFHKLSLYSMKTMGH